MINKFNAKLERTAVDFIDILIASFIQTMKIRKKMQFDAEVTTSSLNYIMFFLLLFFLIISNIANPNAIKVFGPADLSIIMVLLFL